MSTCFNCGSELTLKFLPFEYETDNKIYNVPNVKTLICCNPECGAKYYDAEGNQQIDDYRED